MDCPRTKTFGAVECPISQHVAHARPQTWASSVPICRSPARNRPCCRPIYQYLGEERLCREVHDGKLPADRLCRRANVGILRREGACGWVIWRGGGGGAALWMGERRNPAMGRAMYIVEIARLLANSSRSVMSTRNVNSVLTPYARCNWRLCNVAQI